MYRKKKKGLIIAMFCLTLMFMGIGYAVLSTQLNISGVGKVTGNFLIEIINVNETTDSLTNGRVLVKDAQVSDDRLSLSISAGFNAPGDYLEYDVVVKNNGTIDALLNKVNVELGNESEIDSAEYFTVTHTADTTYPNSILLAGEEKTFQVKLIFNEDSTSIPIGKVFYDVTLDFIQAVDVAIPENPGVDIPETDSACFVSVIPGEINAYDGSCTKSVSIPENLELPLSNVDTISFNDTKCQTAAPYLSSGVDSTTFCNQLKSQFSQMTTQQIYGSVMAAFADATFSLSQDETKYNIGKVGTAAFTFNYITNLELPTSIPVIEDYAFSMNQLTSLNIPNGVTTLGQKSFAMNQITDLTLGNTLVNIGNTVFANNQLSGELVIPASVTTIGVDAFSSTDGSNKITKLTFETGSKLETIGRAAFWNNQISGELMIPATVISIGRSAFESRENTTSNSISKVTFESGSKLETIGDYAFEYNQISGELMIPESVISIGIRSFYGNRLTEVTFGGVSLTSVGENAFYNLTEYANSLITININMTEDEFTNVIKGDSWYSGAPTINYK